MVICIGVVIAYDECTELGQAGHHWSHVCTGMVRSAAELPHTAMEQSSWQSLVQSMWRSPFNFFDLFIVLPLLVVHRDSIQIKFLKYKIFLREITSDDLREALETW